MNALGNIGNLVENVGNKVEAVVKEREEMQAEIFKLRGQLTEKDKEAVKAAQDVKVEMEAAKLDALHFEQERIRIDAKLKRLNDRLITLVNDVKRRGG